MTRNGKTSVKKFLYARGAFIVRQRNLYGVGCGRCVGRFIAHNRTFEKRFAKSGVDEAFERKVPTSLRVVKFDGDYGAYLIALVKLTEKEWRRF